MPEARFHLALYFLFQGNELLTWEILVPVKWPPDWPEVSFFGLKLKDLAIKTRKNAFSASIGVAE